MKEKVRRLRRVERKGRGAFFLPSPRTHARTPFGSIGVPLGRDATVGVIVFLELSPAGALFRAQASPELVRVWVELQRLPRWPHLLARGHREPSWQASIKSSTEDASATT
jgi:hypothetical protein